MSTAGVARHCILFVTGVRSKMPKIFLEMIGFMICAGVVIVAIMSSGTHVGQRTRYVLLFLTQFCVACMYQNCKIITRRGGGMRLTNTRINYIFQVHAFNIGKPL